MDVQGATPTQTYKTACGSSNCGMGAAGRFRRQQENTLCSDIADTGIQCYLSKSAGKKANVQQPPVKKGKSDENPLRLESRR